jgi:replicative DNA helicase
MQSPKSEFLSASQYLTKATSARQLLDSSKLFEFGLSYLDDKLVAGHPVSLTILGADSGVGKTTLVSHIAKYNARKGRNVYCFFLEGDPNLFADREIWNRMAKIYFEGVEGGPSLQSVLKSKGRAIENFDFKHYRYNLIKGDDINKLEAMAREQLEEELKTLYVYDKNHANLSMTNLEAKLNYIIKKGNPDLIIIDHLHYFDMFDNISENANLTNIMKKLVEIVDDRRVPVLVVSHMRKKLNKAYWIPTEEDLHGSGNIFKLASTVVLIAPHYSGYELGSPYKPTIVRIAKDRDGGKKASIGLMDFNAIRGEYEKPYREAKISFKDGRESLEEFNNGE